MVDDPTETSKREYVRRSSRKLQRKSRITDTRTVTEKKAAVAAMGATTMRRETMGVKKGPYHRGGKNRYCGFCVSKPESTICTVLYSHPWRDIYISIQTNVGYIYVHYLERMME